MSILRFIGDVHGKYARYTKLLDVDYSIALGDIGFNYIPLQYIDITKHRCLLGNHDNYDAAPNYPLFLGDFGIYLDMFYIRGGRSVDKEYRTPRIDWWHEEELSLTQCWAAFTQYEKNKPHIVFSHECPTEIIPCVTKYSTWKVPPSNTSLLLQKCFESWQPKMWIFAHYHESYNGLHNGTKFICLDELETIDFNKELLI